MGPRKRQALSHDAKRLKRMIGRHRLSHREVADLAGCSRVQITHYLNGYKPIPERVFAHLMIELMFRSETS